MSNRYGYHRIQKFFQSTQRWPNALEGIGLNFLQKTKKRKLIMNTNKSSNYMKPLFILLVGLLFTDQLIFAQERKDLKNLDLKAYKFINKDGKNVSISDLKGKYVFLDVWASWCRPCINKFPAYDSLKLALKDKNIVCLQISIDANERRWRDGLGFYGRITDQWYTNGDPAFMKDLNIAYIPRYILLDRLGYVLDPKMEWKNNAQMISVLSKLTGIN